MLHSEFGFYSGQRILALYGLHAIQPLIQYRRVGLDPRLRRIGIADLVVGYLGHDAVFHFLGKTQVGQQFSLNLRCDLQGTGVRVTNLEPGLCESEFSLVRFAGDKARYDSVYAGAQAIQPADIAETIFWILNQPAHININSLELMPVSQSWSNFAIERA